VDETKFLGVIFDQKLNFKPHIAYLKDKSLKSLNLLKVIANTKWGADRDSLLQLYRALIRSKLDYGSVVFGSARPSYLERLEPIANKALRLCLGAFRTSPIDSLQVEANEPSLTLRREQLSLQYAIKLQANPRNPAYAAVFEPKYEALFGVKPSCIPPFGIRIATALRSVNPHNIPISKITVPPVAPWTLAKPRVLLDLHHATAKGSTTPEIYLSKFREIVSSYPDRQAIYTDGSKVGDRVACAAVSNTTTYNRRLPDGASIYSAELTAILLALDLAKRDRSTKFFICTDSLSSLEAIKNRKLDQPFIQEIYSKLSKLANLRKSIYFVWTPGHIGIAGNERADKAAREALRLDVFRMPLPWTDFKPKIKQLIRAKWQAE
jgi:ribonuclease HI